MSEKPAADDPRRIASMAVHRDDVANALEATLRSDRQVVLRITPPFSGRMRARIHRVDEGSEPDGPIHVPAAALVETVPAYPEVDDTTAALPDADVETRRERHAKAVTAWRAAVRDGVGGRVDLAVDDSSDGDATHAVDVVPLG